MGLPGRPCQASVGQGEHVGEVGQRMPGPQAVSAQIPELQAAVVAVETQGSARLAFRRDPGPRLHGTAPPLDLYAFDDLSGRQVDPTPVGEQLVQGVPCAFATSTDGAVHGIMCPMGGKILEVNEEALSDPLLVEKDPYFRGWLYRILPSNPDSNLRWLSL